MKIKLETVNILYDTHNPSDEELLFQSTLNSQMMVKKSIKSVVPTVLLLAIGTLLVFHFSLNLLVLGVFFSVVEILAGILTCVLFNKQKADYILTNYEIFIINKNMIMSQKFNDVKMISISDKKREIVVYSKNTFPRKMIFYMYDDFNNMLKALCTNKNWKSLIIK